MAGNMTRKLTRWWVACASPLRLYHRPQRSLFFWVMIKHPRLFTPSEHAWRAAANPLGQNVCKSEECLLHNLNESIRH